jgi:hypothetical protein
MSVVSSAISTIAVNTVEEMRPSCRPVERITISVMPRVFISTPIVRASRRDSPASRASPAQVNWHDVAATDELHQRLLAVGLDQRRLGAVHHGADAGELVRQRDVPAPALVEGGAQDVAAVRAGQPLAAGEVAEHGDVLEELGLVPVGPDAVHSRPVLPDASTTSRPSTVRCSPFASV